MPNFNRGNVLGGHEFGIYSVTNVLYTKTSIVLFFALVKLKVEVNYSVEFVINSKSIVARKLTIGAL